MSRPERHLPAARAFAPTALPSVTARLLAFGAILLAGLCGGLIGYSVTDLSCGSGDCAGVSALGAVIGAVLAAAGVAVIAVLVLRAMAEWRRELEVTDDSGIDPPSSVGLRPDTERNPT